MTDQELLDYKTAFAQQNWTATYRTDETIPDIIRRRAYGTDTSQPGLIRLWGKTPRRYWGRPYLPH